MQIPAGLDLFAMEDDKDEPIMEESEKPAVLEQKTHKFKFPKSYMPEAIIARGVAGLYQSLI